jgi:hypothetical protein
MDADDAALPGQRRARSGPEAARAALHAAQPLPSALSAPMRAVSKPWPSSVTVSDSPSATDSSIVTRRARVARDVVDRLLEDQEQLASRVGAEQDVVARRGAEVEGDVAGAQDVVGGGACAGWSRRWSRAG